jgi:hypothetical protein
MFINLANVKLSTESIKGSNFMAVMHMTIYVSEYYTKCLLDSHILMLMEKRGHNVYSV